MKMNVESINRGCLFFITFLSRLLNQTPVASAMLYLYIEAQEQRAELIQNLIMPREERGEPPELFASLNNSSFTTKDMMEYKALAQSH